MHIIRNHFKYLSFLISGFYTIFNGRLALLKCIVKERVLNKQDYSIANLI